MTVQGNGRDQGEGKPENRSDVLGPLAPYMGLGWVLALSVAGGTVGGHFADRWLGTDPWLTLLGIGLGMVVGFVNVFRILCGEGSGPRPKG
ncbi:MAG: AtpZ/AtpI family protein [Acidobacteriota bacterium]